MLKTISLISVLALGILAGCSSSETATQEASTGSAATTGTTGTTASTEKGKCAGCGAEFPKTELASHDGQDMCKACIAAHDH